MKYRYLNAFPTYAHIAHMINFIMVYLYNDRTIIKRWLFIVIEIETICVSRLLSASCASFSPLNCLLFLCSCVSACSAARATFSRLFSRFKHADELFGNLLLNQIWWSNGASGYEAFRGQIRAQRPLSASSVIFGFLAKHQSLSLTIS